MTNEREAAIESIAARFRSGNSIPVEKATVPAAEWHALVAALSKPSPATEPDGRLHADGYFTWANGKRPNYIADRWLPCDFYLAAPTVAAQPSPAVPVAEVVWIEPEPGYWPKKDGRKDVDFSQAWIDSAPLGTHLYEAPQPTEPAQPVAATWKVYQIKQTLGKSIWMDASWAEFQECMTEKRVLHAKLAQQATQAGAGERQMKECADHMDWLAARLTEVHGEKFNMDYILAARRWAGWLRHKAAPTTEQPATQAGAATDEQIDQFVRKIGNAAESHAKHWGLPMYGHWPTFYRDEFRKIMCAAPTTEQPGDAEDAARWRMLPAFLGDYQINYVGLIRDIDAAIAARAAHGKGGQG